MNAEAGRTVRRGGADLHVHTTHSDGVYSPGEVVRAAASVGLAAVAITDHDTMSALPVARREAERLGIELINGVELTAEREGRELHVLGHFVDDTNAALLGATVRLRAMRDARLRAMIERLASLGLRVDREEIASAWPNAALGRRHLAEWLVQSRQVATQREAFLRYLGDGAPAAVAKQRLDVREAIALIRGAGGVAALAHPPRYLGVYALGPLVDAGLEAIEVEWPRSTNRHTRRGHALAEAFGLVPLRGTDFHAADRPGAWIGAITTPDEDLARLRQRAAVRLLN